MEVTKKNTIIWDVTPCSLAEFYWNFGEIYASIFMVEEYAKLAVRRESESNTSSSGAAPYPTARVPLRQLFYIAWGTRLISSASWALYGPDPRASWSVFMWSHSSLGCQLVRTLTFWKRITCDSSNMSWLLLQLRGVSSTNTEFLGAGSLLSWNSNFFTEDFQKMALDRALH
jgi:hypothetical protein